MHRATCAIDSHENLVEEARKVVRFHGINLRIVYAGMSNNKEPVVLVLNNGPLGCKKLGGSRYSVSVSASE